MKAGLLRLCLACGISIVAALAGLPQTRNQQQRAPSRRNPSSQQPLPEPSPIDEQEVLKIDTSLVTVPVVATSLEGKYVPDLGQTEFEVWEDGVKQEVAFFATVSAPFHVVLLLDTSASTQEKLGIIRRAAVVFIDQLQAGDQVKIISFDDQVRDLNEFTNDRSLLRRAIEKTESGQGTKLYDAIDLALSTIAQLKGRKAIVLFSDGVDWRSDTASFDGTLRLLEEEGTIVYPLRYETRAETERIAREQANDITPQLPTIDVIRTPPSGTTAPTFPSDDPDPYPTVGRRPTTGPLGLPSASEILRRRGESERERERGRDGGGYPRSDRLPPVAEPTVRRDDQDLPNPQGRDIRRSDDSISAMLNLLYFTADSYLVALAEKSGGRLVRVGTLSSLPDAFAQIAAELRTQYAIGYYPINKQRDGKYRKIKVSSTRKNIALRARPGYRAPSGA